MSLDRYGGRVYGTVLSVKNNNWLVTGVLVGECGES